MTGVAGVMALVLAETVAGATLFLWASPLWDEVKRGFFKLLGAILTVVALLTWLSVEAAVVARFSSADALRATTAAAGIATALWTVLLFARQQAAARVVGFLSVPAWLLVLVWMGGAGRQAYPLALFQLAAGAALLGSGDRRPAPRPLVPHGPEAPARSDRPDDDDPARLGGACRGVGDQRGVLRRGELDLREPAADRRGAGPVDRARDGRRDRPDRGAREGRAARGTSVGGAVGDRLLLPRGGDRVHRGGRRQDAVPLPPSADGLGRGRRRDARPGRCLAARRPRPRPVLAGDDRRLRRPRRRVDPRGRAELLPGRAGGDGRRRGRGVRTGAVRRHPPGRRRGGARRRPRGSRPRDLPSIGRGPVRDRARPHARGRRPRRGALLAGLVLDELTAETSVAVGAIAAWAAVVVSVAWGAWRSSPARSWAAPCGPASRSGRAASYHRSPATSPGRR